MTSPPPAPKHRFWFAAIRAILLVGIIPANAAHAAAPAPNVTISTKTIEGEPVVTTTAPGAGSARGSAAASTAAKKPAARSGNTASTSTSDAKVYMEFTIQNQDRSFPTPQLEVTWHLYTKTTSMAGNSANITMNDISGSKTLSPITPMAKVVINSDPVVKNVTSSTSTVQRNVTRFNSQSGYSSSSTASTTASNSVTLLEGWYVEIVYNGTVIKKSDNAEKLKYEEWVKANSSP
jgi:hypothetical protein